MEKFKIAYKKLRNPMVVAALVTIGLSLNVREADIVNYVNIAVALLAVVFEQ